MCVLAGGRSDPVCILAYFLPHSAPDNLQCFSARSINSPLTSNNGVLFLSFQKIKVTNAIFLKFKFFLHNISFNFEHAGSPTCQNTHRDPVLCCSLFLEDSEGRQSVPMHLWLALPGFCPTTSLTPLSCLIAWNTTFRPVLEARVANETLLLDANELIVSYSTQSAVKLFVQFTLKLMYFCNVLVKIFFEGPLWTSQIE